ncbi:MAG: M24 family metallopeptidase [Microthrixaceae bacterium]
MNEIVCHGIPDDRVGCSEGDIVNVDVTAYIGGVHGDTSATFLVGEVDPRSRALVDATRHAMHAGHLGGATGRPHPRHRSARSRTSPAAASGTSIVREFIGHGIGDQFHTCAADPALLRPPQRHGAAARHDLHRRADDQHRSCSRDDVGRRLDGRRPPTCNGPPSSSTPCW